MLLGGCATRSVELVDPRTEEDSGNWLGELEWSSEVDELSVEGILVEAVFAGSAILEASDAANKVAAVSYNNPQ
jgi:hypothetical protein